MPVKNPNPMHPGRILAEIYMVELGLNQSWHRAVASSQRLTMGD